MKAVFEKIRQIVEKELSSSAHNMDHVMRVHDLCMHIAKDLSDIDLDVLEAAVLLHDIARIKENKDSSGNTDHAVVGSVMAEKILNEVGFPSEKIESVKHCITAHRFRTGNTPKSKEAQILFDADKLDTLGAVGIARLFMVAGEHSEKTYSHVPVEEYVKENLVGGKPNGRIINPSKHSPNLDFETKLKTISDKLYTSQAKNVARERLEYMHNFFNRLKNEVEGRI